MKPTGESRIHERTALVRLTSVRVRGFRGLPDTVIDFDPVTTIIGEHGPTKAAIVALLDSCLGPESGEHPRFARTDFPEARGDVVAAFRFSENAPGVWDAREPALARVASRASEGLRSLTVVVAADGRRGTWVDVPGLRVRASPAAVREAWARLRALSPVLILNAERPGAPEAGGRVAEGGGKRAEIKKLYRRLRDGRGELMPEDVEAARALLEEELHLGSSLPATQDERELVDVVDWRRRASQDVNDDAVQGVIKRLVRVGLVLEALKSGRLHPDAVPILVVDSPDAHLHPIHAARVWRFLHSVASQLIVTTNSAEVIAACPLRALRRIARTDARVRVGRVVPSAFSIDDLRRLIYHVRLKRGASLLARAWFLVEGETEVWILSEFAAMLGYSFPAEGVACIEFAQCGLTPLVRLADQLGIGWHVLTDGDTAGVAYALQAKGRLQGRSAPRHLTQLAARDLEEALWEGGYDEIYRKGAGNIEGRSLGSRAIIRRALDRGSKPLLAIRVIERALQGGSPGVPRPLAAAIRAVVAQARRGGRA
jgi:putative ATP-dependent endonuclease of the OLD family